MCAPTGRKRLTARSHGAVRGERGRQGSRRHPLKPGCNHRCDDCSFPRTGRTPKTPCDDPEWPRALPPGNRCVSRAYVSFSSRRSDFPQPLSHRRVADQSYVESMLNDKPNTPSKRILLRSRFGAQSNLQNVNPAAQSTTDSRGPGEGIEFSPPAQPGCPRLPTPRGLPISATHAPASDRAAP